MRAPAIEAPALDALNRVLRRFGLVLRTRAGELEGEKFMADLVWRQMLTAEAARLEARRMRRQLFALEEALAGVGQSALSITARRLVRIGLGKEEERAA